MSETVVICARCIYDEQVPGISFDDKGICNYCRQVEAMEKEYGTGTSKGKRALEGIIERIRRDGKGRKYDCIVGVSGGTDSSYLLMKAVVDWGLRPLAVHYDNTWNTAIATQNIRKVTSALNVDLYTYVVNNKEVDDIFRSFLLAGVPEFDASTDIALAQVIRSAAAKYRVKYVLEAHSFKTEGISPIGNNYFDGKYVESIHRKYGKRKMRTFPNMTFYHFMKWVLIYRQKFIRPFWYIEYSKSRAREELQRYCGWEYYGGHHLENRATAFLHLVYNPIKFGIDNRNWSLAAAARSGELERNVALDLYRQPIEPDNELIEYVKKRLELSDREYNEIMEGPNRCWRDFPTYKQRFERLRLLFYLLARANLVPMSFYLKYCFPTKRLA
ncbi:MAG: N-acetyl sugar amidotransferase [Methanobacteriota archaeon]|nr:MAG: N-acetyl sugar amidotransferase [Euryarchaeota archaeon]